VSTLFTPRNKLTKSWSCCPEDGSFPSKSKKGPSKSKIKSASRKLKKLNFEVLGTISLQESNMAMKIEDEKFGFIEVSKINNGWLDNHYRVMELRNKSSKLYLVLA